MSMNVNNNSNTPRTTQPSASESPASSTSGARPSEITIQKGDTLSGLAQTHGTSVDELMKLNPQITNPNRIYAGSMLKLPKEKATSTETPAAEAPAAPAPKADAATQTAARSAAAGKDAALRKGLEDKLPAKAAPPAAAAGAPAAAQAPTGRAAGRGAHLPAETQSAPTETGRAAGRGAHTPAAPAAVADPKGVQAGSAAPKGEKPAETKPGAVASPKPDAAATKPAEAPKTGLAQAKYGEAGAAALATAQKLKAHGLTEADFQTLVDGNVNDQADLDVIRREGDRVVGDAAKNGEQVTPEMLERAQLLKDLGTQLISAQAQGYGAEIGEALRNLFKR